MKVVYPYRLHLHGNDITTHDADTMINEILHEYGFVTPASSDLKMNRNVLHLKAATDIQPAQVGVKAEPVAGLRQQQDITAAIHTSS